MIPEKARKRPLEGEVIAVGPSVKDVKIGDRVLYGFHSAQEWVGYGTVVREPDLIAVLG